MSLLYELCIIILPSPAVRLTPPLLLHCAPLWPDPELLSRFPLTRPICCSLHAHSHVLTPTLPFARTSANPSTTCLLPAIPTICLVPTLPSKLSCSAPSLPLPLLGPDLYFIFLPRCHLPCSPHLAPRTPSYSVFHPPPLPCRFLNLFLDSSPLR